MPFKAATVMLSNTMYKILSKFSNSRTYPARQVQRAKIIVLASEGLNNMQISQQVGLGQDSVSKWRTRFINATPALLEVEQKKESSLEKELTLFLLDNPRPGQPMTYTDEQIIRILELACRPPKEYGYETSHWSLNQLCAASIKEGIVETISAKTVSRFLKYGENPPSSRPLLASFLRKSGTAEYICAESKRDM